jgi:DNA-directed RNA polymerase sigma subunit (sigma70/sigma32)
MATTPEEKEAFENKINQVIDEMIYDGLTTTEGAEKLDITYERFRQILVKRLLERLRNGNNTGR